MDFHKTRRGLERKKANETKHTLERKERKELKKEEKEEQNRLKLIKENNMDEYISLITEQKNSRLMNILESTHKYLEQLGAKVEL